LPDLSSLELLCTTTSEDQQRHVRERLAEYDMPYFCFGEEQRRARDGSPAPITNFYIAGLQIEWASDRLADFFRGGSSVLLARAADDFEAGTYRAALEDRDIGYTTSRIAQYPMVAIGPLAETLFFVAEVDVEAARRAIEDFGNGEAPTISAQEVAGEAVPGPLPADDTGPDPQESSASSTAGFGVSGDASRPLQDLRDERRYMITRLLLFISATINLFMGAVNLGTSMPIGVSCLFFGTVLAALGRWSRRNPEPAFGWSLLLLILNVVGALATSPWWLIGGLFSFITILATLFSWRRARERRLEGSRQGRCFARGLVPWFLSPRRISTAGDAARCRAWCMHGRWQKREQRLCLGKLTRLNCDISQNGRGEREPRSKITLAQHLQGDPRGRIRFSQRSKAQLQ
jgi:hypothetical protein